MREALVIIPALEPERKLIDFIIELQQAGFDRIVIVDDGSGISYSDIFSQAEILGCIVVHHSTNLGKGEAIKTGIRIAVDVFGRGYPFITADADGQHLVKDIVRIDDALLKNPDCLVLGVRDFSQQNVPFKSRAGNRITSMVFRLVSGVRCPDTQTGLRGIPASLVALALKEEGSRYEYEMNMLQDAVQVTRLVYVPITTVYEDNNSCSHFRPVRDSLRIYGRLVRYIVSSLTGAAVDYLVFFISITLISLIFAPQHAVLITSATVIARCLSGIVNFFMNRTFAFRSHGAVSGEALRYFILFICQMAASAGCVTALSYILPALAAKIIVDTILFFISYIIQKKLVFNDRWGQTQKNKKGQPSEHFKKTGPVMMKSEL